MKTVITDERDIILAAQVIRDGGLVAFPTETVYGLGGNALRDDAAKKIYAAKGRPSDNPLIIHLSRAEDAEKYCYTNSTFYKLAKAFMPGPITVILKKKDIIPDSVTGGLDTVAVRIPKSDIARKLIEASGVPICAPSANISGKPSPTKAEHVIHDMDGRIDMIIDGGDCDIGLESTIVKIDGDVRLTLCRPGAVTYEMLCALCDNVMIDKAVVEKMSEGEKPVAPGMKYRHYAPDIPVVIVDGGHADALACILRRSEREKCGALIYEEDIRYFSHIPHRVMGSINDQKAAAHELFDCLRSFDGADDIDKIYTFMPDKQGIGLAVFNRLIKAAGFTIIKAEEE